MVATLAGIVAEIGWGTQSGWVAWASLALALPPILLAGGRTVPNAVRLGARADPDAVQGDLARAILRDHIICLAAIAGLIALQLAAG